MKFIVFIVTILLFSQHTQEDKFDMVTIWRNVRTPSGIENKKVIKIDVNGIVYINNKEVSKVNIATFTKSLNSLIEGEGVVKMEASNDPLPMAPIPENGFQIVSVVMHKKKDIESELKYNSKSRYVWRENHQAHIKDFDFYKYLTKEDRLLISEYLEID